MINQDHHWSEVAKKGNPTRAASINKLLCTMRRMEVACHGKPSMALCSFVSKEFECLALLYKQHNNTEVGLWLMSYVAFQLHMIARLDKTAKFRLPDLKPFHQYLEFGCTTKLCLAKTCMEKRNTPT